MLLLGIFSYYFLGKGPPHSVSMGQAGSFGGSKPSFGGSKPPFGEGKPSFGGSKR